MVSKFQFRNDNIKIDILQKYLLNKNKDCPDGDRTRDHSIAYI